MAEMSIHVCHIVFKFATGGLENGVVNLINRLPNNEFKHSIICISDSDPKFVKRIVRNDVEVFHLNKPAGRSFGYLWQARQLIKQLKPNIVHTRNLSTIEAQVACIGLGITRVHGEHGWDGPLAKFNKKHIRLRRLIKPLISRYVVLSNESYQYLRQQILVEQSRINLICNGVDTEKFICSDKPQSQLFNIIAVGRLVEVKNYPMLLKALASLVFELGYTNVQLTIVGDGGLREQLAEQIFDLGLEPYCKLLGDRSDIPQLLMQADVFVLASTAEGISNTILEAMSTGTAVIATDVGGNSELVEHQETGIIVASNDLPAMVDAISRYIKCVNNCHRHGLNGRLRIENKFSIDSMVNKYAELYRRLT